MAGLDSILGRISKDSADKCDVILEDARAEAAKITDEALKASEAETANVLAAAEKQAETMLATAKSGSVLENKKELLKVKVSVIEEAIQDSLEKLNKLPDGEYFDAIYALVKKYAQPQDGVIYLSSKDLGRLPADFQAKLDALTGNGKLTVSSEPRDITGGFILAYGDIELNCTFDALVSEQRDEIKDELNRIIFA